MTSHTAEQDSHEHGSSIWRQHAHTRIPRPQLTLVPCLRLEQLCAARITLLYPANLDGGHAAAPVERADLHAVHIRLRHQRQLRHHGAHLMEELCRSSSVIGTCLGGGHVLAFPAECVAQAVDKIHKALIIDLHVLDLCAWTITSHLHQVAGAEPGVTLAHDVVQNLRR